MVPRRTRSPDRYGKTESVSLSSLIGATPQASPSSALPGCRQVLESGEKENFDRKNYENCRKMMDLKGKNVAFELPLLYSLL